MARWFPGGPPPRKAAAPRDPSGKINHRRAKAEEAALPYFVYAQRLRGIDPKAYDLLMLAHVRPERALTSPQKAERKAQLMIAVRKASDSRLGYPLGRLWAIGLLCPAPADETPADQKAREEHAETLEKAGRIYAAQHYIFWNGLGSPGQRVPSHLEKILTEVWDDAFSMHAPAEEEIDPVEIEKARQKLKNNLSGARRVLLKAFPMGLALKAVERVVIDKFAAEVQPVGPVPQSILKPLRAGLEALREYYNVRQQSKRERDIAPVHVTVSAGNGVAPSERQQRVRRQGLSVEFDRSSIDPPSAEEVARSITRHLRRKDVSSDNDIQPRGSGQS